MIERLSLMVFVAVVHACGASHPQAHMPRARPPVVACSADHALTVADIRTDPTIGSRGMLYGVSDVDGSRAVDGIGQLCMVDGWLRSISNGVSTPVSAPAECSCVGSPSPPMPIDGHIRGGFLCGGCILRLAVDSGGDDALVLSERLASETIAIDGNSRAYVTRRSPTVIVVHDWPSDGRTIDVGSVSVAAPVAMADLDGDGLAEVIYWSISADSGVLIALSGAALELRESRLIDAGNDLATPMHLMLLQLADSSVLVSLHPAYQLDEQVVGAEVVFSRLAPTISSCRVALPLDAVGSLWISSVDVDGDQIADVVVGDQGGGVWFPRLIDDRCTLQ